MPHSYTQLLYHIVYATKSRHPWLAEPIRSRLHAYLGGAIRDEGGTALAIGGVADHVHILARLRQDKAVSAVIGAIKANSSGWIHREFADLAAFEWQEATLRLPSAGRRRSACAATSPARRSITDANRTKRN